MFLESDNLLFCRKILQSLNFIFIAKLKWIWLSINETFINKLKVLQTYLISNQFDLFAPNSKPSFEKTISYRIFLRVHRKVPIYMSR